MLTDGTGVSSFEGAACSADAESRVSAFDAGRGATMCSVEGMCFTPHGSSHSALAKAPSAAPPVIADAHARGRERRIGPSRVAAS